MISRELVVALDQPLHRGEVRMGREGPEQLGLRLFFPNLEELSGLDLPPRLAELARELTARFDLVPGHWCGWV